jgi:type I restriction enzyme S subunit
LVRGIVVRTVHPDKLIRCQIASKSIAPAFLETASNSWITRTAIERCLRTTAGQVGVSGTDIKSAPVPVPPYPEQLAITETVQEKFSQIDAMEAEVERGLARASRLRQAILKAAFAGKLVPQDPNDEPASVLLERIRAERARRLAETNGRPKRAPRKKTATRTRSVPVPFRRRENTKPAGSLPSMGRVREG